MRATTATTNNIFLTTKYDYGHDNEYVLTCKGRPFAVLVSPSLQTPTSSLLDYDLVRSLGLKLTDLQCRKYTLGGSKYRILGRVTTAVQCVQNGKVGSTFHLKCDVVADLYATLDTHCVASAGLQKHLGSQDTIIIGDDEVGNMSLTAPPPPVRNAAPLPEPTASAAPPEPPTPSASPPTATTSSASSAPTPCTPPRVSAAPPAAARPPRSPPGFPTTPQHRASADIASSAAGDTRTEATIPVCRVLDGVPMSPFTANIRALGDTFNDADLARDEDEQLKILEDVDSDGDVDFDENEGSYMYKLSNGLQYTVGHGRHGCSLKKCPKSNFSKKKMPSNCGYHSQWALPEGFQPCGDRCKQAFCYCLRLYHAMTASQIMEERKMNEKRK